MFCFSSSGVLRDGTGFQSASLWLDYLSEKKWDHHMGFRDPPIPAQDHTNLVARLGELHYCAFDLIPERKEYNHQKNSLANATRRLFATPRRQVSLN